MMQFLCQPLCSLNWHYTLFLSPLLIKISRNKMLTLGTFENKNFAICRIQPSIHHKLPPPPPSFAADRHRSALTAVNPPQLTTTTALVRR
nr:hypothetical protein Iba_chr11dCG12440 [Ipomoea batatas]